MVGAGWQVRAAVGGGYAVRIGDNIRIGGLGDCPWPSLTREQEHA